MITIRQGEGLWTVGILEPETESVAGSFTPLRDCNTVEDAMAWMSYLNGGEHPHKPWSTEE